MTSRGHHCEDGYKTAHAVLPAPQQKEKSGEGNGKDSASRRRERSSRRRNAEYEGPCEGPCRIRRPMQNTKAR